MTSLLRIGNILSAYSKSLARPASLGQTHSTKETTCVWYLISPKYMFFQNSVLVTSVMHRAEQAMAVGSHQCWC